MKKNRMMRLASGLLVAVLLTTCAISGTFAKYVTEASGKDSARVAEWGVRVSGMGDGLFVNTYAKQDSETSIANTVEAEVDVVAPGTNNEGYAMFSLTGTPEVAVRIKIDVTDINDSTKGPTDVVLAKGKYWDWTKAPYTTKFEADEYHPLVFTLKDGANELMSGTLSEIEEYLEEKSGDYEPNTDLSKLFDSVNGTGNYTLSWAWAFEQEKDKEDTVLGNIAAGIDTATAGTSTSLNFKITVTATQID